MSINSFNQEKIKSISDLGLKNLVSSLYKFKGIDGVKLVQEALNLAEVSDLSITSKAPNLKVDGWFGDKSIERLESTDIDLLNIAIDVILENQSDIQNSHRLSKTSLKRLKGVHPDIVKVVKQASLYADIFVVEGLRSQKRQNKLKKSGNSQISRSYHLYGLAVDLVLMVNGKIDWNTIASYKKVYKAICRAEDELGLNVMDNAMFDLHWKSLTDYPHWQMTSRYVPNRNPRKFYKDKKGVGFTS